MKKKTRKLLLVIILFAIIGIGIGYAALSQNLTLNGAIKTKSATEWDVKIDSISEISKSDGTTDSKCSVNPDSISATFGATLIPGGSVTYKVTTTNLGSIAAKASTPIISYGEGGDSEYIECIVTPDSLNSETIQNSLTHTYTVTMNYAQDNLPENEISENVIITFPYSQAE